MSDLPLHGIRVIDLSHSWAAPHCTRLLADFGAEVIKVEYVRRLCLLRGARRDEEMYNRQPGWSQVNRGKLSITLDLQLEEDRNVLRDLVKVSDVLVENSRTGVMEKWGLGYPQLAALKPDLIVLSMPAFGHTGPWASFLGYGAIFEVLSGVQGLTAYDKEAKPTRIKEIDVINGLIGTCAVMTALFHREDTGEGQHIDLSQLEAATHGTAGEHLLEFVMNGEQTLPLGNRHYRFAPQGCYPCRGKDKWIAITVRSDTEWRRFCETVGHPEWLSDPRFATGESRRNHHDELDQLIEAWTVSRDHYEAMNLLQRAGIPAGAVLEPSEISTDPHLQERGYFLEPEEGSRARFTGTPIRLSEGGATVRWPGPPVGHHNEHVLCDLLGRSKGNIPTVRPEDVGLAYDPHERAPAAGRE